jgi:uncharacterized small protein (DUF1192 family)
LFKPHSFKETEFVRVSVTVFHCGKLIALILTLHNLFSTGMKEILNFSGAKLKRMAVLKAHIERLEAQLEALVTNTSRSPAKKTARKKRTMSAAARRKISLAAKARWAKVRAAKSR